MEKHRMFVNGEWIEAASGDTIPVLNPATEETAGFIPRGNAKEAELAVEAAAKAQKNWADLSPVKRAAYLKRVVRRISENKEHFVKLIVKEQGKPLNEAFGEVDGAIFLLEHAAEWALRIEGDVLPSERENEQILIMKVPHGVTLGITPWNYPLAVPARKIGPALVTGNTIVLKPHEATPLSALELTRMFELEGLPPGVLNVVTGTGEEIGAPLAASPKIDFITLTGSVRAGRSVYMNAARNIASVSLELGGKAPFIVMDDADVDSAVKHAVASRMANCGQVCICNERTYVHEAIYDEFVSKLAEAMRKLRVGNPLDPATQLGPKVSREELDKVHRMVRNAKEAGAEIVLGGEPLTGGPYDKGYWFPPTLITNVHQQMEIMREEVFGPVIPIMKFSHFEEAVSMANDSKYGLSAYLFTNNYRRIMQAIREIDFGEIFINRTGAESFHAFHGGYRNSGVHGDDGKYGIDAYLKKKTVYLNFSEP
jgi:lactaldehyde dehydrogenase/glycolaldehyde dehydrogenase